MSDRFKKHFAGAAQVAAKAKEAASAKAAKAKGAMSARMGSLAIDAKKTNVGQMLRHKTLSTGTGLGTDAEYTDALEDFTRLKSETKSLLANIGAYKKAMEAAAGAGTKIGADFINVATCRGEGGQRTLSDVDALTDFVARLGGLSSIMTGALNGRLSTEVLDSLGERMKDMDSLTIEVKERDLLQKDADTCAAKFQKVKVELAQKDAKNSGAVSARTPKDEERLSTTEAKMKESWQKDLDARNALLEKFGQFNTVVRKEVYENELAAFRRIVKEQYETGTTIISDESWTPPAADPVATTAAGLFSYGANSVEETGAESEAAATGAGEDANTQAGTAAAEEAPEDAETEAPAVPPIPPAE